MPFKLICQSKSKSDYLQGMRVGKRCGGTSAVDRGHESAMFHHDHDPGSGRDDIGNPVEEAGR